MIWDQVNWNSRSVIMSVVILSKLQYLLFLLLHETAAQGSEHVSLDFLYCDASTYIKI